MSIEKEFEEVFMRFVDESPRKALSTITGHFVGLTLALIEVDGHEVEGDIFKLRGCEYDRFAHCMCEAEFIKHIGVLARQVCK